MTTFFVIQLVVKSGAFAPAAAVPPAFTCDGADKSPSIQLESEMPAGTQSWALIVDDPDAPSGTFVHWVIWNLPASVKFLTENVPADATLSEGGMNGQNGAR